ncbi:hypothetical protein F0Z19_5073 [Vibrio cyclitrophicus]|uniref:hypothetical protein n=1 Tax=unclassified Vibrio TaxID=2614977 RepID=UPI001272C1C1|nr:hypothetical protein F0Z19_5073 [Vibrio cyclitrophicus]
MKYLYSTLLLFIISAPAQALKIDSMLTTADEYGNGVFTLTNELASTSFITSSIEKVDVVNGELVKTPYSKDNLNDWEITVTHPKLILESQRVKQVGIRSLCGNQCNFEQDKVYQITFAPVPYVENPEQQEAPLLAINFGYAPLFVIPAAKSKIAYEMTYKGDTVLMKNTGNTYVRFMISKCTAKLNVKCQSSYTSLSGRVKEFIVPEYLQDEEIEVMVVNHDETYRRKLSFVKGQSQTLGN